MLQSRNCTDKQAVSLYLSQLARSVAAQLIVVGRSQAVRHMVLVHAFVGSIPTAPANIEGINVIAFTSYLNYSDYKYARHSYSHYIRSS